MKKVFLVLAVVLGLSLTTVSSTVTDQFNASYDPGTGGDS